MQGLRIFSALGGAPSADEIDAAHRVAATHKEMGHGVIRQTDAKTGVTVEYHAFKRVAMTSLGGYYIAMSNINEKAPFPHSWDQNAVRRDEPIIYQADYAAFDGAFVAAVEIESAYRTVAGIQRQDVVVKVNLPNGKRITSAYELPLSLTGSLFAGNVIGGGDGFRVVVISIYISGQLWRMVVGVGALSFATTPELYITGSTINQVTHNGKNYNPGQIKAVCNRVSACVLSYYTFSDTGPSSPLEYAVAIFFYSDGSSATQVVDIRMAYSDALVYEETTSGGARLDESGNLIIPQLYKKLLQYNQGSARALSLIGTGGFPAANGTGANLLELIKTTVSNAGVTSTTIYNRNGLSSAFTVDDGGAGTVRLIYPMAVSSIPFVNDNYEVCCNHWWAYVDAQVAPVTYWANPAQIVHTVRSEMHCVIGIDDNQIGLVSQSVVLNFHSTTQIEKPIMSLGAGPYEFVTTWENYFVFEPLHQVSRALAFGTQTLYSTQNETPFISSPVIVECAEYFVAIRYAFKAAFVSPTDVNIYYKHASGSSSVATIANCPIQPNWFGYAVGKTDVYLAYPSDDGTINIMIRGGVFQVSRDVGGIVSNLTTSHWSSAYQQNFNFFVDTDSRLVMWFPDIGTCSIDINRNESGAVVSLTASKVTPIEDAAEAYALYPHQVNVFGQGFSMDHSSWRKLEYFLDGDAIKASR